MPEGSETQMLDALIFIVVAVGGVLLFNKLFPQIGGG
jgi:hypothetical protein